MTYKSCIILQVPLDSHDGGSPRDLETKEIWKPWLDLFGHGTWFPFHLHCGHSLYLLGYICFWIGGSNEQWFGDDDDDDDDGDDVIYYLLHLVSIQRLKLVSVWSEEIQSTTRAWWFPMPASWIFN